MSSSRKVLAIDDEADVGEFVAATAQNLGLKCTATTAAANLPQLLTPDVSLILLDLMMPEMDGIEALRLLSELKCKAGIVLMSGISKRVMETAEKLANTLGLCVVGHLAKPILLAELEVVLKKHRVPAPAIAVTACPQISISDERMRLAVERDEFVLHYQPQIAIASGAVTGVEALARWQHPEHGLLYPESFIGRMEDLGLIDDLCWLVADRALAEVRQFASSDRIVPRLALNVSPQSLRNLKFPDKFMSLLRKHRMPPEAVILEITEGGLINELSNTLEVLIRLRVNGVQLSIDDFGTGFAMMKQLVNIPSTELKIDKNFVMNMNVNSSDRVMVEKSIEIGHELGMKVIAEGVETDQQLEFLRRGGCDFAQGFLYTRALPPNGLVRWLAQHHAGAGWVDRDCASEIFI